LIDLIVILLLGSFLILGNEPIIELKAASLRAHLPVREHSLSSVLSWTSRHIMWGNGAATGLCLQILEFKQPQSILLLCPIGVFIQLRFKVPRPPGNSNGTIIGRCGYYALKLDTCVWRAKSPYQRVGDVNPIHWSCPILPLVVWFNHSKKGSCCWAQRTRIVSRTSRVSTISRPVYSQRISPVLHACTLNPFLSITLFSREDLYLCDNHIRTGLWTL
jgi:hypothetical protein